MSKRNVNICAYYCQGPPGPAGADGARGKDGQPGPSRFNEAFSAELVSTTLESNPIFPMANYVNSTNMTYDSSTYSVKVNASGLYYVNILIFFPIEGDNADVLLNWTDGFKSIEKGGWFLTRGGVTEYEVAVSGRNYLSLSSKDEIWVSYGGPVGRGRSIKTGHISIMKLA